MLEYLFDLQFMVVVLAAVAAFATVVTIFLPQFSDDRLDARVRYMASERDELRSSRLAELKNKKDDQSLKGKKSQGFMQEVVKTFNLKKILDTEEMRNNLKMAGLRGEKPVIIFLFFRLIMPIICFFAAIVYMFIINDLELNALMRFILCGLIAYLGFFLPNVFISNMIQKRQEVIKKAFPDALDLLLICVQAGMAVEAGFGKVAKEIRAQCIELAEEFSLTTAELSYLSQRTEAYDNFAKRTGLPAIKSVTVALIQSERYGTPLAQSLRVLAQESREMRMAEAEKKAAALPPKLTVPMIVFFLPVLFVVLLGPAIIKMLAL